MAHIYTPALKAKMGELSALQSLTDAQKGKICPILEVPGIDWNYVKDEPAKTLKKHIEDVIRMIEKYWDKKFYIDFSSSLQISAADEKTPTDILTFFDNLAKDKSLAYIPVVDFDKNSISSYRETLQTIHTRNNDGICLRIKYADLEDIIDEKLFEDLLTTLGVPASEIDLMLDFGSVNEYESDKTLYLATRLVLASTPRLKEWRSLSVLASSFPYTLSGISKSSIAKLPRKEWLSWKRLNEKKDKLVILPIYGDYGISHPKIVEIDPRVMDMSAAIRYSTPNDWLILKGESIKKGGFIQFPELSKKLARLPEYSGKDYSSGDERIYKYANGDSEETGTGNATTWRTIGNNHHFCLVIEQLSNPSSASK